MASWDDFPVDQSAEWDSFPVADAPVDSGQGYGSSLASSAGRGAAAIVPGVIGGVGYLTGSDTLKGVATDIDKAIESALPINPLFEDDFSIKAANALGQAGSMLGTGGIGGVIGKGLGGVRAGAQIAGLGTGFLQGTRGGGLEADRYGMTGGTAYARALLGGMTELATEKLLFGMGSETAAARKLLGETLETGAGGFGKAVVTEGLEEGAAELAGNVATKTMAPEGVKTPGVTEGVAEATGLGMVGGTLFGGVNALAGATGKPEVQSVESGMAETLPTVEPGKMEIDGVGTIEYDKAKIAQPEMMAAMSRADLQKLADSGMIKLPVEPAKDEVTAAAEAVVARADVAPETAKVIEEITGVAPPKTDEQPITPAGLAPELPEAEVPAEVPLGVRGEVEAVDATAGREVPAGANVPLATDPLTGEIIEVSYETVPNDWAATPGEIRREIRRPAPTQEIAPAQVGPVEAVTPVAEARMGAAPVSEELLSPQQWAASGKEQGTQSRVIIPAAKSGRPINAELWEEVIGGTPSDYGHIYVRDGEVFRAVDFTQPEESMTPEEALRFASSELKSRALASPKEAPLRKAVAGIRSHIGLLFDPAAKNLESVFSTPETAAAISEAMAPVRETLRKKYGDTVTLYRAESKGDSPRNIFSYSLSEKIARSHARDSGREVVTSQVPIEAIVWLDMEGGEQEVLVDRRKLNAPQTQAEQPLPATATAETTQTSLTPQPDTVAILTERNNAELPPEALARWTPEVYAAAAAYDQSGDTAALQDLTAVQRRRVQEAYLQARPELNEQVSRAETKAERRLTDDENKDRKRLKKTTGKVEESYEEEGTSWTTTPEPKGRGTKPALIQRIINDMRKQLPGMPKVEIITTEQARTDPRFADDRRFFEQQGSPIERIGAWIAHSRGTVYMVADNTSDEATARRTLLHEVIGHMGINAVATTAERRRISRVVERYDPEMAAMVQDLFKTTKDTQLYADELLAKFAESYAAADPDNLQQMSKLQAAWDEIKRIVVGIIRRLGGDARALDDVTLHKFYTSAVRSVAEGQAGIRGGYNSGAQTSKLGTPAYVDVAYAAAVEAGDTEAAQKLVDQAAKMAGYDSPKVYHGSPEEFTKFDESKADLNGFWFTTDSDWASKFGPTSAYYLRKAKTWGGDDYVVKAPEDAKSADPITYDDAGNVIPLSQRFNAATDDIRTSLSPSQQVLQDAANVASGATPPSPAVGKIIGGLQQGGKRNAIFGGTPKSTKEEGSTIQERLAHAKRVADEQKADTPDIQTSVRESDFGLRANEDERFTQEFRDIPAQVNLERPQQDTHDAAAAVIKADGREVAYAKFTDPASDIRPEVRIAGLMQLAHQYDMLAEAERLKGNEPGTDAFDTLMERAIDAKAELQTLGNDAGRNLNIYNTWARMSPEGMLRRFERELTRKQEEVAQAEFGADVATLKAELAKIKKEYAEALKAAPPSTLQEAVARFESSTVSGEDSLRVEFERIVREVREERTKAVEKANAEALKAWELSQKATKFANRTKSLAASKQRTEEAWARIRERSGQTNLPLFGANPANFADYGSIVAEYIYQGVVKIADLKDRILKDFGAEAEPHVQDLISEGIAQHNQRMEAEGVAPPRENKPKKPKATPATDTAEDFFREQVEAGETSFDEAVKKVDEKQLKLWLDNIEKQAASANTKQRRADFMAALKIAGIADKALERLSKALSDTPSTNKKGEPHPIQAMINDHIKTPNPDFVEQLRKLGIPTVDATQLAKVIELNRSREEVAAREKALQQALEKFKPKTRKAKDATPKMLRSILNADNNGILTRTEFTEAFSDAFELPKLTMADRAEILKLSAEIRSRPEGSLRQFKANQLLDKLALIKGVSATDAFIGVWYANILSGLATQGVNVWGNGAMGFVRSLSLMLASGNVSDAFAMLKGLDTGYQRGWQEAKNTWRDGSLHKGGKLDEYNSQSALEILKLQGTPKDAAQWIAWVLSLGYNTRYVFRAMAAADAVFWYMADEGFAHLAVNKAIRDTGLTPGTAEFNAAVVERMGDTKTMEADRQRAREELLAAGDKAPAEWLVDRRAWELRRGRLGDTVNEGSSAWADRLTLQQEPEGMGKVVSKLIGLLQGVKVGGVPIFRAMVPFNRVVSNLFESGLDFAGVGILRGMIGHHLTAGEGGRKFSELERRERFVAGLMGITVAGVAYALAQKFKDEEDPPFAITGFGPRDPAKRAQWLAEGNRPFSMKVGDQHISYAETPLGMLLAGVGAWMDAETYETKLDKKSAADRFLYIALAGLQGFSSQGVLSSVGDTLEIMTGNVNQKKLSALPIRTLGGAIPAQGLLRDSSTLFDPNKIDDKTFYGALVKDIPVLKSMGTRPALNVFGEPVKIEGLPVVRRFVTGEPMDPTFEFLGKHNLLVPALPASIEIGTYLPKTMKDASKKRALQMTALEHGMMTPDQRYQFVQRSGELTKKAVETLRKNAPDKLNAAQKERYQETITKRVGEARRTAMLELVRNLK